MDVVQIQQVRSLGEGRVRFQQNPLDNTSGRGARVFLEDISRVLIKMLSAVYNLNKATHILGLQLNS